MLESIISFSPLNWISYSLWISIWNFYWISLWICLQIYSNVVFSIKIPGNLQIMFLNSDTFQKPIIFNIFCYISLHFQKANSILKVQRHLCRKIWRHHRVFPRCYTSKKKLKTCLDQSFFRKLRKWWKKRM